MLHLQGQEGGDDVRVSLRPVQAYFESYLKVM
jgi:hypothetical protein